MKWTGRACSIGLVLGFCACARHGTPSAEADAGGIADAAIVDAASDALGGGDASIDAAGSGSGSGSAGSDCWSCGLPSGEISLEYHLSGLCVYSDETTHTVLLTETDLFTVMLSETNPSALMALAYIGSNTDDGAECVGPVAPDGSWSCDNDALEGGQPGDWAFAGQIAGLSMSGVASNYYWFVSPHDQASTICSDLSGSAEAP